VLALVGSVLVRVLRSPTALALAIEFLHPFPPFLSFLVTG
jgi:hypothetical protein